MFQIKVHNLYIYMMYHYSNELNLAEAYIQILPTLEFSKILKSKF